MTKKLKNMRKILYDKKSNMRKIIYDKKLKNMRKIMNMTKKT